MLFEVGRVIGAAVTPADALPSNYVPTRGSAPRYETPSGGYGVRARISRWVREAGAGWVVRHGCGGVREAGRACRLAR